MGRLIASGESDLKTDTLSVLEICCASETLCPVVAKLIATDMDVFREIIAILTNSFNMELVASVLRILLRTSIFEEYNVLTKLIESDCVEAVENYQVKTI